MSLNTTNSQEIPHLFASPLNGIDIATPACFWLSFPPPPVTRLPKSSCNQESECNKNLSRKSHIIVMRSLFSMRYTWVLIYLLDRPVTKIFPSQRLRHPPHLLLKTLVPHRGRASVCSPRAPLPPCLNELLFPYLPRPLQTPHFLSHCPASWGRPDENKGLDIFIFI